jgi:hypothetical protein
MNSEMIKFEMVMLTERENADVVGAGCYREYLFHLFVTFVN